MSQWTPAAYIALCALIVQILMLLMVFFGGIKSVWAAAENIKQLTKSFSAFQVVFEKHIESDATKFDAIHEGQNQLKLDVAVIKDRIFSQDE